MRPGQGLLPPLLTPIPARLLALSLAKAGGYALGPYHLCMYHCLVAQLPSNEAFKEEGAAARCGGGGRAAHLTWSQAADRCRAYIAPACLRQKTHRPAVLCVAAAGPKRCALLGRLSVSSTLETDGLRQQEQLYTGRSLASSCKRRSARRAPPASCCESPGRPRQHAGAV